MSSALYIKHGRLYVCLAEKVLVSRDPENTHYAVMQDLDGQYAPFLVDLSIEQDWIVMVAV